jgi:glucarate dehydratase
MEFSGSPIIAQMHVIPVAGHDSMLLNLSGAHGRFFTRNLVILKDAAGHTGVGEVPGGNRIRETLLHAEPLVIGKSVGTYNTILRTVHECFAGFDGAGRGLQTFDLRITHNAIGRHRFFVTQTQPLVLRLVCAAVG